MAKKLNTTGAAARLAKLANTVEKEQQSVERTEIIPIDSIIINNDNIFSSNDTEESIAELAENIKENGLLHNIVVAEIEPDKYLLISGERRTKAVKFLGRDKIKATIRANLSELEILKMLFFANSETREYTTEEKIHIIESFLVKLEKFEGTSEKEAAKKFREYVSQAFNVNERQASKLITITSELTKPLKQLLYTDIIDINTAAALAQLPAEYQEYATDIISKALPDDGTEPDSENKKYAVTQALTFAKQSKNIISKTNTSLTKERTSQTYHNGRLIQAKEDLSRIIKDLDNPEITPDQIAELTTKKSETERTIAKYEATLEQLEKEIDVEIQKQHNEVKKIYTNSIFSVEKGPDDVHKDKSGKIAQNKKISKEVQAVDTAIKRLLDMNPSEELKAIQDLLEKYKSTLNQRNE